MVKVAIVDDGSSSDGSPVAVRRRSVLELSSRRSQHPSQTSSHRRPASQSSQTQSNRQSPNRLKKVGEERRESVISGPLILRKARQIISNCISQHPQYRSYLQQLPIETSGRMTSSAAKTVFDTASGHPTCIRVSVPVFEVPANYHSADFEGVVLHEAAHAIAGVSARHNAHWERVCREIGGIASCHHSLDTFQQQTLGQSATSHTPARRRSASSSPPPQRRKRHRTGSRSVVRSDRLPDAARSLIDQIIQF